MYNGYLHNHTNNMYLFCFLFVFYFAFRWKWRPRQRCCIPSSSSFSSPSSSPPCHISIYRLFTKLTGMRTWMPRRWVALDVRDASADQVFFGLASSLDFVRPSVDEIQNKNLFTLAEREERGGRGEEKRTWLKPHDRESEQRQSSKNFWPSTPLADGSMSSRRNTLYVLQGPDKLLWLWYKSEKEYGTPCISGICIYVVTNKTDRRTFSYMIIEEITWS